MDFADFNKCCQKNLFSLPHINKLVDTTAVHQLMSFIDAFFGYNQILMHPQDQDQEKTSFMMFRRIYSYEIMYFGIKNDGSTYQKLVNMMFADQIGQTMEVYIDDVRVFCVRVIRAQLYGMIGRRKHVVLVHSPALGYCHMDMDQYMPLVP